MPLKTKIVWTKTGLKVVPVFSSNEDKSMQNKDYEYSVSGSFLKKYILDNGGDISQLKEVSKKVYAGEVANMVAFWDEGMLVDIPNVKSILILSNKLDYHKFIDAYCKHLKSL